jgi:hypothetical protein
MFIRQKLLWSISIFATIVIQFSTSFLVRIGHSIQHSIDHVCRTSLGATVVLSVPSGTQFNGHRRDLPNCVSMRKVSIYRFNHSRFGLTSDPIEVFVLEDEITRREAPFPWSINPTSSSENIAYGEDRDLPRLNAMGLQLELSQVSGALPYSIPRVLDTNPKLVVSTNVWMQMKASGISTLLDRRIYLSHSNHDPNCPLVDKAKNSFLPHLSVRELKDMTTDVMRDFKQLKSVVEGLFSMILVGLGVSLLFCQLRVWKSGEAISSIADIYGLGKSSINVAFSLIAGTLIAMSVWTGHILSKALLLLSEESVSEGLFAIDRHSFGGSDDGAFAVYPTIYIASIFICAVFSSNISKSRRIESGFLLATGALVSIGAVLITNIGAAFFLSTIAGSSILVATIYSFTLKIPSTRSCSVHVWCALVTVKRIGFYFWSLLGLSVLCTALIGTSISTGKALSEHFSELKRIGGVVISNVSSSETEAIQRALTSVGVPVAQTFEVAGMHIVSNGKARVDFPSFNVLISATKSDDRTFGVSLDGVFVLSYNRAWLTVRDSEILKVNIAGHDLYLRVESGKTNRLARFALGVLGEVKLRDPSIVPSTSALVIRSEHWDTNLESQLKYTGANFRTIHLANIEKNIRTIIQKAEWLVLISIIFCASLALCLLAIVLQYLQEVLQEIRGTGYHFGVPDCLPKRILSLIGLMYFGVTFVVAGLFTAFSSSFVPSVWAGIDGDYIIPTVLSGWGGVLILCALFF